MFPTVPGLSVAQSARIIAQPDRFTRVGHRRFRFACSTTEHVAALREAVDRSMALLEL